MPKFEATYTEKDFIDAMGSGFVTPGFLAKKVGSARATAMTYLGKLEREGKVEKTPVDEGQSSVWKLIK